MVSTTQIKCDVCNKILDSNELSVKSSFINFGNAKPKPRNHVSLTFEDSVRGGDLCFVCARDIKNFIDDLKGGGRTRDVARLHRS